MTVRECRINAGLSAQFVAKKMDLPLLEYIFYETYPYLMSPFAAKIFSSIVGISYNEIFFNRQSILNRIKNK